MEKEVLYEAAENISLIKSMIERTSKTFISFSKIFIYLGLLFLIYSGIHMFLLLNQESGLKIVSQNPYLTYMVLMSVFILLTAFIYVSISKKMPLVGLEKSLMKVWLLTIVMNMIPIKVDIDTSRMGISQVEGTFVMVQTNSLSVLLFSLAIALILTSQLANYKQPRIVGLVYIGFSILYAFSNNPIMNDGCFGYLSIFILPITFLYLGFYLKSKQVRGD